MTMTSGALDEADPLTDGNEAIGERHARRVARLFAADPQFRAARQLPAVIEAAKALGAEALNVSSSPAILFANRQIIMQSVAALRLPAIYALPEMAEEGGLLGYGPRILQIYRDMVARQAAKLFLGTRPTDLPVEQPTKFELAINLKTAKTIGHDIPAGLVLRADTVIE